MEKVICCAHRGAMAYAPENTMKAFRLAADMGADMIELDVHLTRDGAAVVNHDPEFSRAGPAGGKIKNMTLGEVRAVRIQGEPVPTLEEALLLCKERGMEINIECKACEAAREIVRLVRETGMRERTLVSSFSTRALAACKQLDPEISVGYLTLPLLHPAAFGPARRLRCASINPNLTGLTRRFVAAAHKRGIKVIPWTVNDARNMRRLIAAGADGIITNKPDLLNKIKKEMNVE